MKHLICLKHPRYRGNENPDLKCKVCCAVFVQRVKARNAQQSQDISSWLESKSARETITWTI